jgi:hypothetical protein
MIFPTGQHHGQDVVPATPLATLRPTQGQLLYQHAMGDTALACFGQIPWIVCPGVQRAQRRQSNCIGNNGNDGNSNSSNVDDRDGDEDGNNNKGDVDGNGGSNDNYNNNDINDDNDNNDDGMTTWQRQRWNNDDGMTTM